MSTKSKRSFRWLLWALAFLGLTLDQVGKYGVFKFLHDEAREDRFNKAEHQVIPGALKFHVEVEDLPFPEGASVLQTWSGDRQPRVNKGAFLGFGNGTGGGPNGNLVFAVVSVVAAVAIVWWST